MNNDEWLTVSEVSEREGIPVETLRRYIRNHGVHMKVKKIHKRYSIHKDSVDVIRQIRDLYEKGSTLEVIERTLTNRGIAMTVTVEAEDDEKPVTISVPDELQRMNEMIEEQKEFNKLLLEELHNEKKENQEFRKYVKESLEKRDHALTQTMTELLETRRETAATEEVEAEKKWWQFWK